MFNPVIIVAIIVQGIISKVSHLAGCIAGYLITTGILLWGLSVYSDGDFIALFGIPLTKPVFLFACVFWYGYDTYELFVRGGTEEAEENEENIENEISETI